MAQEISTNIISSGTSNQFILLGDWTNEYKIGYYIAFEVDDYSIFHKITNVTLVPPFGPTSISTDASSYSVGAPGKHVKLYWGNPQSAQSEQAKSFNIKVFDDEGLYITTWYDVINSPQFVWEINGGLGECKLTLLRTFDEFGENKDVAFNNKIEIWSADKRDFRTKKQIHNCDTYNGNGTWIASFDAANVRTSSRYREGTGSIAFDIDVSASANNFAIIDVSDMAPVDLSEFKDLGTFRMWVYFPSSTTNIISIRLLWGDGVGYWYDDITTDIDGNEFSEGWNLVEFEWEGSHILAGADVTAINHLQFRIEYTAAQVDMTAVKIDDIQARVVGIAKKIYSGRIVRYEPALAEGKEVTDVFCQGYVSELNQTILRTGAGATDVTYSSQDPSDIIKSIIDHYDGEVHYTSGSIEDTSTNITYTFKGAKHLEALRKCQELAPDGWYWFCDADNVIYFKLRDTSKALHEFVLGKHCRLVKIRKEIETVINEIFFVGGGDPQLYRHYERAGSISAYGRRAKFIQDERVTVTATADLMAAMILDAYDTPETVLEIELIDDYSDAFCEKGYNLESIKPGDSVQLKNYGFNKSVTLWDIGVWDVDVWDFDLTYSAGEILQIKKINYTADIAKIEITTRLEPTQARIEDINRNLEIYRNSNLPASPT